MRLHRDELQDEIATLYGEKLEHERAIRAAYSDAFDTWIQPVADAVEEAVLPVTEGELVVGDFVLGLSAGELAALSHRPPTTSDGVDPNLMKAYYGVGSTSSSYFTKAIAPARSRDDMLLYRADEEIEPDALAAAVRRMRDVGGELERLASEIELWEFVQERDRLVEQRDLLAGLVARMDERTEEDAEDTVVAMSGTWADALQTTGRSFAPLHTHTSFGTPYENVSHMSESWETHLPLSGSLSDKYSWKSCED